MAFRSLFALMWWSVFSGVLCDPQAALTGVTTVVETDAGGGQFLATAPAPNAQPAEAGQQDCNACYVVLDVAAVVWYKEVFVDPVATAMVSIGVTNGSRTTSTSIVTARGPVTYGVVPPQTNGVAVQPVPYGLSTTISGATLNSPTAYNVVTGYSVTSAYSLNGICVTTGAVGTLSTAISETLAQASGFVTLNANDEYQLIRSIGFSSCSNGGAKYTPSVLAPLSPSTIGQTNTYVSGTPLPAITGGTSIPTLSFPSVSAPTIVAGSVTYTPNGNPFGLQTVNANGTSVIVASTGVIPIQPTRGNASTSMPVPFISRAPSSQQTDGLFIMSAWILGLVGIGFGVYHF